MGYHSTKPLPPIERIVELFFYDFRVHQLCYRTRKPHSINKIGGIAGTVKNAEGRRQVDIDGGKFYAARVVWKFFYGVDPTFIIDHKDNNNDNNDINNLLDRSQEANCHNRSDTKNNGGFGASWYTVRGLPLPPEIIEKERLRGQKRRDDAKRLMT